MQNDQKQIEIKFRNFIWNSSFKFMSPIYSASKGILNGSIQGKWTNNWESGQWLVQIKGNEIIDTNGVIPDFITHTFGLFDLDVTSFQKQMLNVSGVDGSFFLNSLVLENSEVLKINGKLNSKNIIMVLRINIYLILGLIMTLLVQIKNLIYMMKTLKN